MPLPDSRMRSTRYGNCIGPSSVTKGIQRVAPGPINDSKRSQGRKELVCHESRQVVNQTVVCAGSLRVRSCKLLWKPAALQLVVTSTTSLSEDESHFDDCDDDSDDSDDNGIDKLTTMTRPNTTHHYSLVFCHRSLLGHACRERIELNRIRDPVEFIWGKDGMMSTRFEFSIVYGKRRRSLNCRARDAKDYLQWTKVLRTAMASQGKKCIKMNRPTQTSSNASSNSRSSNGSFFSSIVKEPQQLLDQTVAPAASSPTPTLPTRARTAIAPPTVNIAKGSALIPVPADIAAAAYKVGHRRKASAVANPVIQSVGIHLQRGKQSRPSLTGGVKRRQDSIPMAGQTLASESTTLSNKHAKPRHQTKVTVSRPSSAGQRSQRTSSAARGSRSTRSIMRPRKDRLLDNTLQRLQEKNGEPTARISSSSKPKTNPVSVLPVSTLETKRLFRVQHASRPVVPVLDAVPTLQSRSPNESPHFIINERPTTVYVNTASSAPSEPQQLQWKKARPVPTSYESDKTHNDPWLTPCQPCRRTRDMCDDVEDAKLSRSNRGQRHKKSWAAYLQAMECEL